MEHLALVFLNEGSFYHDSDDAIVMLNIQTRTMTKILYIYQWGGNIRNGYYTDNDFDLHPEIPNTEHLTDASRFSDLLEWALSGPGHHLGIFDFMHTKAVPDS